MVVDKKAYIPFCNCQLLECTLSLTKKRVFCIPKSKYISDNKYVAILKFQPDLGILSFGPWVFYRKITGKPGCYKQQSIYSSFIRATYVVR